MRPPQLNDWMEWRELRARNEQYLRPFEPEWDDDWRAHDYFLHRLNRQAHEWRHDKACAFLIFKKQNNALIGGMNINNICRGAAQYATLGYWIVQDHQGQGYMAEALSLTLQYCFDKLKLHRVNAAYLPENTRSENLLLRGGFKREGFAEKYISINGAWRDHSLFGISIESWLDDQKA